MSATTNIPNLEFYFKKSKIFLYLLICMGFIVISLYLITTPKTFVTSYLFSRNSTLIFIIGVLGFLLFSLAFLCILVQFFDKKPFVVISVKGINQRVYFRKNIDIKWSQIKVITPFLWEQRNIGTYGLTKNKVRFLQIITFEDKVHYISTVGLGMSVESLFTKIEEFYNNLPKEDGLNVKFMY